MQMFLVYLTIFRELIGKIKIIQFVHAKKSHILIYKLTSYLMNQQLCR